MGVTTKQIAEICGVGRATVDRALNNRQGINEETKKKILKVAKELGYRPNWVASSLSKGRTMTIGVIVFDLYNRFFAQLLNSIELAAKEKGYFVYLTLTDKDPETEKSSINHLVDRKVDGIILFSVNKGEQYDSYLKSLDIPVITIGNVISDSFPFVGIDYYNAIKEASNIILETGYKQIVYVSPSLDDSTNHYALDEKLRGIEDIVKEAKLEEPLIQLYSNNYLSELDNFFPNNCKTAIVCSSDIYSLEILNHLTEKGYSIPQDVGIMGFDDIDMLKYVRPRLSTVAFPIDEIGKKSFEYLISKINGEQVAHKNYLPHKVIIRDTI